MNEEMSKAGLEFMRRYPISYLATVEDGIPWNRVIRAARIDDDFSIWYSSAASSNKVRQIGKCPSVSIVFHEGGKYLYFFGRAEIINDPRTKHEMWQDRWSGYFPKGTDDPEYVLIKAIPNKIEYRDMDKRGLGSFRIL